jgi:Kef-type K+ transport system membrane component KefB
LKEVGKISFFIWIAGIAFVGMYFMNSVLNYIEQIVKQEDTREEKLRSIISFGLVIALVTFLASVP